MELVERHKLYVRTQPPTTFRNKHAIKSGGKKDRNVYFEVTPHY